jgi:hypothetical protein
MTALASVISAVAKLLWPILFGCTLYYCRVELRGLIRRLKKGKFPGGEFELYALSSATSRETAAKIETELQDQLKLPPPDGITVDVPAATIDLKNETDQLETLACKRFAEEHPFAAFRTRVKIGSLFLDALLETPSQFIVVEVKVMHRRWYLFTALQQGSRALMRAKELMLPSGRSVVTVLIFVYVDERGGGEKLDEEVQRIPPSERPDQFREYSARSFIDPRGTK